MLSLILSALLAMSPPEEWIHSGCDSITFIAPYRITVTALVQCDCAVEFQGTVTQPWGPGTDAYLFHEGSGITLYAPCYVSIYMQDPVIGNRSLAVSWGGPGDFNCDGDVGTDADIEDFFQCLALACTSGDFDGDLDVATDADIASFFAAIAGAGCP